MNPAIYAASLFFVFKAPVTYSSGLDESSLIPFSTVIDAGDVDEKRVKLSHHRSGLLQFSEKASSLPDSMIAVTRGGSVFSHGPSITQSQGRPSRSHLRASMISSLPLPAETRKAASDWIVFDVQKLPPASGHGFVLEGFYSPLTRVAF